MSEYLWVQHGLFSNEGGIQTSTIMTQRSLLVEIPFDPALPRFQDADWVLRAYAAGATLVYCPSALTIWHIEEGRLSIAQTYASSWEQAVTWIRARRDLVTPRAYAAFLLIRCGNYTARARSLRGAAIVFREALRHGHVAPVELAVFLGMWLIPPPLRRQIRRWTTRSRGSRTSAVSPAVGRASAPGSSDRRLLLVTSLWPTPDRRSAGIFVQRRAEGTDAHVIGPRGYSGSVAWRYLDLAWRAISARGRFAGVEAHVLFPTGLIGLIAARMRRLPLVVYAHGTDVRRTAHRSPVHRWLAKQVARRAAAVVVNSHATAALVRSLGREPIVIPPGVDFTHFGPSPRPPVRSVLYLGGSRHQKGYDRAIGLADTLAGPGLAEVEPDRVSGLIASHDVVLVPSREEGFGLVALEAIASGRWVVAADVEGLREIIEPGVNGALVSDGDYISALAAVPDYDPFAVADTVRRYSEHGHRTAMARLWNGLLSTDSLAESEDSMAGGAE